MPEAVEIRVISEYLDKVWKNKLIVSMGWDSKSKFVKTGIKGLELVKVPCKVTKVYPRGKVIIIECVNNEHKTIYMISQLGMEGRWIHAKQKHSNFRIYFGTIENNQTTITDTWYYDDSRHFGHFNVYSSLDEIKKNHGPCLLSQALSITNEATLEVFMEKIKNKRIQNKQICDFVMEQKHVSGIGNYLRAEILYRSKINPTKTLSDFKDTDIEILYKSIMYQLRLAYNNKGLTIKSYWDPEGNAGKCPLQVYNQDFDPYGNKVEKFKDKQNRTVHWVPTIQIS